MKIKPLADRVLVLPAPAEEKTIGGIIIPDSAKEKSRPSKSKNYTNCNIYFLIPNNLIHTLLISHSIFYYFYFAIFLFLFIHHTLLFITIILLSKYITPTHTYNIKHTRNIHFYTFFRTFHVTTLPFYTLFDFFCMHLHALGYTRLIEFKNTKIDFLNFQVTFQF